MVYLHLQTQLMLLLLTEAHLQRSRRHPPTPHSLQWSLSKRHPQAIWPQCMMVLSSPTFTTLEWQCCLMLSLNLGRSWSFRGEGDSWYISFISKLISLLYHTLYLTSSSFLTNFLACLAPPHYSLLPSCSPPKETKTESVHPAEHTPQTHPGYYVFSPDDDESSEEENYDPDCGGVYVCVCVCVLVCFSASCAMGEMREESCWVLW